MPRAAHHTRLLQQAAKKSLDQVFPSAADVAASVIGNLIADMSFSAHCICTRLLLGRSLCTGSPATRSKAGQPATPPASHVTIVSNASMHTPTPAAAQSQPRSSARRSAKIAAAAAEASAPVPFAECAHQHACVA